jgi:hypothetical protein
MVVSPTPELALDGDDGLQRTILPLMLLKPRNCFCNELAPMGSRMLKPRRQQDISSWFCVHTTDAECWNMALRSRHTAVHFGHLPDISIVLRMRNAASSEVLYAQQCSGVGSVVVTKVMKSTSPHGSVVLQPFKY